jgi:hypothetical protein
VNVFAEPPFMVDSALGCAGRGVPVFPLQPRSKHPFPGSHGFKDATTDTDVIRAWWSVTRAPDANIGAATGVMFDVCDVDGPDALDALCNAAGFDDSSLLTTGPVAETPRGWHLYFTPTGSGNRAGFIPGCDWRGVGGYAVLPPSLRGDDFEYRSLENGDGTFDLDRALTPVPGWLHALLIRNVDAENRRVSDPGNGTGTRSPGFWDQFVPPKSPNYFAAALNAEAHAVSGAAVGTRNDQLNRSTHTLARLDGLASATIDTVMLAAALDAGLGEHEALATIRSALRARGVA